MKLAVAVDSLGRLNTQSNVTTNLATTCQVQDIYSLSTSSICAAIYVNITLECFNVRNTVTM